MLKRILFPLALLGVLLVTQPRQAQAIVVTAVECSVVVFPCPAIDVVDAGVRANGVGLLGPNRYTLLPFAFANADVSFTGNLLAMDLLGTNVYIWGGGVATNTAATGFYLDVQISQNYVTSPGIGQFSEFNIGNCTNNTIGTTSGVAAVLGVNGNSLGTMGSSGAFGGDCVAGAGPGGATGFAFANGPIPVAIGGVTNLTALAQFYFSAAGGAGQSIDLPWGEDFPDLTDYGTLLPTPSNLSTFSGVTDQAPEPSTFTMIGGAFGLAALAFFRRKR